MPKIVKNLTDKQIKSAITAHKNQEIKSLIKLSDGKGLFFVIDKKGCAFWRFDYVRPVSSKRNSISFGTYPEVSLGEAREKLNEYRKLISQNIDPIVEKDRKKEQAQFLLDNTFKSVAEEFRKTEELESSTQKRNAYVWEKLYLSIGNYPISEITATQILDACRLYEKQGKTDSARRMRSKASQVYRYAIALGLCQFNIADQISGILKTGTKTHRAAITDSEKLGQLLKNIDQNFGRGEITVDYALKILPHVFVRPGELRSAKWADIDFEKRLWSYTPPKTKNQTALQHVIPLSDQVFNLFKELYEITRGGEFCFVSMRNSTQVISDSTINKRLKMYGFENGETTGHGFRATARTLLDEVLKFPIERIKQQLAHQVRDMHGRAYNRTKYLEERKVMMQAWSNYLDKLKKT
ncbi:tyrosine-type recombinase/integrase [Acinetobacter lwoffii]|uniref:tyrosine-type recombinase/integrase n=1 Tax=Acinetobacter lwoffii TaxID=28090 RepID=UPI003F8F227F